MISELIKKILYFEVKKQFKLSFTFKILNNLKKQGFKHLGFTKNFETTQPRYSFRIDLNQSLEDIEIPNGVTEIGFLAFSGCTSLKELKIPNSVTEIGFKAFESVPHVYYKGKAKDPEKKAIFFRGIWGAKKFN